MKITKAVDYALKSCLYLAAKRKENVYIPVRALCRTLKLRRAYLLKILKVLQGKGLVSIRRGAHGGYRLSKPAAEISVMTLLDALEGPFAIHRSIENPKEVHTRVDRRIRDCWEDAQEVLVEKLEDIKLCDFKPQDLFRN